MATTPDQQYAQDNMSYNTPDGKPPDHRQILIDMIAQAHGPQAAIVADSAFKNQDKQIKEAMTDHGMSADEVLKGQGIDLNALANPQKGFLGRWQDNFNKQVGNVTNSDVMSNLLKASEINKNNQQSQAINPEKSIQRMSDLNKIIDEKLPGYQVMQSADGNFIVHPKPASENDMVIGLKEQQQQDRLEKTYTDRLSKITSNRSGGLGLQDGKVNQAIHLRTMINQAYDPKTGNYNVTQVPYEELAIGLANLVANSNQVTESMRNGIRQKTAAGDYQGAVAYFAGKPTNAAPQEIIHSLVKSIDRQGQVSEQLRNKYMDDFRKTAPSRLDKNRMSELEKGTLGSSYEEFLNQSPDKSNETSNSSNSSWNNDKESRYQELLKKRSK